MKDQKPSPSDPTPQRRVGDVDMRPVIIAFFVTVLIILVAAIILLKTRQTKIIPKATDPHPTTHMTQPHIQGSAQLSAPTAA
jgi:hypothetical protein